MKWILDTVGNVSATPAVVDGSVYVTDWGTNESGGYIYKIDATDGSIIWRHQISEFTENPNSVSRNTPAVQGDFVVFGDQAPPATVIAIDTQYGNLIWKTIIDEQFLSSVTQSPVIYQGKIFVGTASRLEEGWSLRHPGYIRTFRGSINALDLQTGKVLAQTYMSPPPPTGSLIEGYTGTSVWTSRRIWQPSDRVFPERCSTGCIQSHHISCGRRGIHHSIGHRHGAKAKGRKTRFGVNARHRYLPINRAGARIES